MTRIIAFLAAILLATSAGAASTTSRNVDITVTHAGGLNTALPAPPAGFHWTQTFGDEFNPTFPNSGTTNAPVTLDTSTWQLDHYCGNPNFTVYASPTYGCGGNTTASDVVSNGILTMTIQATMPATRNIIDTWAVAGGAPNQHITGFVQRYGFFVYDSKLPTCSSGEWDLESFGRDTWTGGAYGELAWASLKGACNYSSFLPYEIDNNRSIHWYEGVNAGVDVTLAFHQYGVLWTNDGSPHGSVVVYFDGRPVTSSHQLVSPSFDNGLYFDIYWSPVQAGDALGGQGTDPHGSTMQFDWIRAYQLAPN
jgi:hypothetical protein